MEEHDDSIAEVIIQRLKSASVVVSFAEVAREAKARNRNRLAAQVCIASQCVGIDSGDGGVYSNSYWTMKFMQETRYHCSLK